MEKIGMLMLNKANKLRKEGLLVDVSIQVECTTFKLHSFILATFSDYFRDLFTSDTSTFKRNDVITLSDVSAETASNVFDFFYTEPMHLDHDNILDLLEISEKWLSIMVKMQCEEFLEENLDVENASYYHELADKYNLESLRVKTSQFLSSDPVDICLSGRYDELEFTDIFTAVKSDILLEKSKWMAVKEWVNHDPSRLIHICALVKELDLTQVDGDEFRDLVDSYPSLRSNLDFFGIVLNALLPPDDMLIKVIFSCDTSDQCYLYFPHMNQACLLDKVPCRSIEAMATIESNVYAIESPCSSKCDAVSFYKFDFIRNKWSECAPLPYQAVGEGICSKDRLIYVSGGGNSKSANRFLCYEPLSDNWTSLADMQRRRIGHQLVAHLKDDCIYAIGGMDENNVKLTSVEKYKDGQWTFVSDMNEPRAYSGAVYANEKIYIAGNDMSNSVECYNLDDDTWTYLRSFTHCRQFCSIVEYDDGLLLFGHEGSAERYEFKSDEWNCFENCELPDYLMRVALFSVNLSSIKKQFDFLRFN